MNRNNLLRAMMLIAVATLFSCSYFTKDKAAIDDDMMRGKYEVDIAPLISKFVNNDSGIAALALSSVKVNVSFYKDNKGVFELGGKVLDFASLFSDEPIDKIHQFSYIIESDSVFYIKLKDNEEFKETAIVRKLSDNYDYLQFSIINQKKDILLNLSRVSE